MAGVFLTEQLKKELLQKFSNIQTVDELANLLNWIEKNDSKHKQKLKDNPVGLNHIDSQYLHFLSKTKETRYNHFTIEKKSGSQREIRDPDIPLKRIQKLLNCLLQVVFSPKVHYCTNGFSYGRDIVRNARPHLNKKYVLNCDIKNFFPSVNYGRVRAVLRLSPFNFINDKEVIANLIASLCTYENRLPQGAPTSPILSNLVTQKLDRKISAYCNLYKIKYSRYADDLTFSSNTNYFNDAFIGDIRSILLDEQFQLNEVKTRLKTSMDRQQVTGIIVNKKLNVRREYIKKVRAMLNNWEKKGLKYASLEFKKKLHSPKDRFNFVNVLSGYVSFIGNVKGKDDPIYRKYRLQLETLRNRIDYSFIAEERVLKRLSEDNLKMERILLDTVHAEEEKFIAFCTSGFHQIENLLNYYYWKRFPILDDLLIHLILQNPRFKQRYKTLEKAQASFKKIGDLNISVLLYVFEQEFYFKNSNDFYDRRVSKLREIRNDDSHRCSVHEYDKEKVIKDFENLQFKKESFFTEKNKYPILNAHENEIEFKFNLLKFLETKDFYFARKIVREVSIIIKSDLPKYSN